MKVQPHPGFHEDVCNFRKDGNMILAAVPVLLWMCTDPLLVYDGSDPEEIRSLVLSFQATLVADKKSINDCCSSLIEETQNSQGSFQRCHQTDQESWCRGPQGSSTLSSALLSFFSDKTR